MEPLESRVLMCAFEHDPSALPSSHFLAYSSGVSAASLGAGTGAAVTVAAAVPAGWVSQDVGNVGKAGSTVESGGVFTVTGAGADIYDQQDSFHYTYGMLTGDGQIIARVDSFQKTHNSAKFGVMIRESLSTNSKNAYIAINGAYGGGFQYRTGTGGSTSINWANGLTAPKWVKLVRLGDTISASYSSNGTSWTTVGSTTVAMQQSVHIGLAVLSHDVTKLSTAKFSNVTVTPLNQPTNPPPTGESTTVTIQAESTTRSSGTAVGTQHRGFTGTGYVNLGSSGNYISIPVTTSTAGTATITIRYANGGTTNRPLAVSANGTAGSNLVMAPTGGWTTWTDVTVNVNLPQGANTIRLSSTGSSGANIDSIKIESEGTTTPPPAGSAWNGVGQDIGNVGKSGNSSTGSDNVTTVAGSGADIWGTADAFHFSYQELTGNGSIVARVVSQQNTDPWAKAGLMIRESLNANSKFAFSSITPSNGTFFSARSSTGNSAWRSNNTSYSGPIWLKLTRSGNTLTSFRSNDGVNWTQTGQSTISMASKVYIGLAVTSHKAGTLSAVKFDNAAVTGTTTPPPTGNAGWTSVASAPMGKYEHAGMAVGGKLYSFGGFYNTNIQATTASEVYDPATNKWSSIADMPEPLTHAGQATDGRYVYLVSGFIGDHPGPMTDHFWRYDTVEDVWFQMPNLPYKVGAGAAALVGRTLYFFGGTNRVNNQYLNDVSKTYSFNLDNPSAGWTQKADMPVARNHLAGVSLDGLVYAIGGQRFGNELSGNLSTVSVYNPATNVWSSAASLPIPQGHLVASAFVMDGKIRVIGGVTQNSAETDNVFEYNPATNAWSSLTSIPGKRQSPLADVIDGIIYVSGGFEPGSVYTTTWKSN